MIAFNSIYMFQLIISVICFYPCRSSLMSLIIGNKVKTQGLVKKYKSNKRILRSLSFDNKYRFSWNKYLLNNISWGIFGDRKNVPFSFKKKWGRFGQKLGRFELLPPSQQTAVSLPVHVWKWIVRIMVLNTIFNNISVISWRLAIVLLVEETEIPGENHRPVASYWRTWSHNVVLSTPHLSGIWTHNVSGDS
jgi:hypothetical protein